MNIKEIKGYKKIQFKSDKIIMERDAVYLINIFEEYSMWYPKHLIIRNDGDCATLLYKDKFKFTIGKYDYGKSSRFVNHKEREMDVEDFLKIF